MKIGDKVRLTEANIISPQLAGLTGVVTNIFNEYIHVTIDDNPQYHQIFKEIGWGNPWTLDDWPFEVFELEIL